MAQSLIPTYSIYFDLQVTNHQPRKQRQKRHSSRPNFLVDGDFQMGLKSTNASVAEKTTRVCLKEVKISSQEVPTF